MMMLMQMLLLLLLLLMMIMIMMMMMMMMMMRMMTMMMMMMMMMMKGSVSPVLPLSAIASSKEHTAWKRNSSSSFGFLLTISGEKTWEGRFDYGELTLAREQGE
jgi:hypothetical protein